VTSLLSGSREYSETKTKFQRGKVYKDIFKSQWRHWGNVHPEWWMGGFLDYSENERRALWSAFVPASTCGDLSYFSPVFFAGGLSSLNRGKGAGAGILGDNSV